MKAGHRVLGIDPGLANLGLGAVVELGRQEAELILAELVHTPAKIALGERLATIYQAVHAAIEQTQPHALAIEGQYFHRQREASFKVGQAVGVALLAAQQLNIPVFTYGPMEVKQTLVGSGRADKTQVSYMVRALLGPDAASKQAHHVSDALALALTHLARRRIDGHITGR